MDSFILNLPDELLQEILAFAALFPQPDQHHWIYDTSKYTTARSLCLVCRRFRLLGEPLLYHSLSVAVPFKPYTEKLRMTLGANPELGQACRLLKAQIDSRWRPSPQDVHATATLLGYFQNLRELDVNGEFIDCAETWPLLASSLAKAPRLEKLTLSRPQSCGLGLKGIYENVNLPNLKVLDLQGVVGERERDSSNPILGKALEGTASFTTLNISDFEATAVALSHLIKWPKTLEHFTFEKLYSSVYRWDFNMFPSRLSPHRESLISIKIGSVVTSSTCINVSDFPKLESISLSHWELRCSPEQACSEIFSAPSLHEFTWDFRTTEHWLADEDSDAWDDFGPDQAEWLRKVTRLCINQNLALRTIKIIFTPESWGIMYHRDQDEEQQYPWDLMDQVRDDIAPHGITLSYSEPTFTREEFHDYEKKMFEELG